MKQYGTYQYVFDAEEIEPLKPKILKSFAYGVAAHRLEFPESYKWIIREPNKNWTGLDPLGAIGGVGIKANCESLPWHKGWFDMIKARIWLWRHHVVI